MKKHPDTDVLHSGEGARGDAAPLTTPIYSATTFLFENAAELEAYQRGESGKYIYSRYANPTVQASGGAVTFTLWVVNCSPTSSAWNILVTDRLPDNTYYDPGTFVSWPGNATPGVWDPSYSSNNTTWSGVGQPALPQGAPYYLRYTLNILGPGKSAFASFQVVIL